MRRVQSGEVGEAERTAVGVDSTDDLTGGGLQEGKRGEEEGLVGRRVSDEDIRHLGREEEDARGGEELLV